MSKAGPCKRQATRSRSLWPRNSTVNLSIQNKPRGSTRLSNQAFACRILYGSSNLCINHDFCTELVRCPLCGFERTLGECITTSQFDPGRVETPSSPKNYSGWAWSTSDVTV